jgi:hypothetical protein
MHMHITKAGKNSIFRTIGGNDAIGIENRKNRNTKVGIGCDMNQINIPLFHNVSLLFKHKERPKPVYPGRPHEIIA